MANDSTEPRADKQTTSTVPATATDPAPLSSFDHGRSELIERGWIAQWWRDLQVATAFWTWLPTGLSAPARRAELGRSRYIFPLVGLLIAVLPAFAFALADWLHLGALAAATIAVCVMMSVTGGRAEVATAAIAEALCRSRRRETRAKILAETRPGYFGVIELIFLVLLKIVLLANAGSAWDGICALVAAAAGSRGGVAVASWFADTDEGDRLGGLELESGRETAWVAGLVTALLILLFLWFWSGLVGIALLMVVLAATVVGTRDKFGGMPIYVAGMMQQIGEITLLATAVAYF